MYMMCVVNAESICRKVVQAELIRVEVERCGEV